MDFEEEGVKEEKSSRDDDCAAQPETNNKRAKIGFEEEEDKEDKEKDNKKFTITERDSKLRERFNAKLVAKATTIETTSTLNIRGRGHAFKKQREEEDEINDEKLDEIEP